MATASSSDGPRDLVAVRRRLRYPRTLRGRVQAWLAFLLVGCLAAMIVIADTLNRTNRLNGIDANLEARVASLSLAVREFYRDAPPPGERPGPRPFGRGFAQAGGPPPGPPSGRPPGRPGMGPPPDDGPPRGFAPPDRESGLPPPRPRPEDFEVPRETADLFGAASGNYFTIWYRDGSVLGKSSNADPQLPPPGMAERDTLPHFRTRGEFREAIHCSGLGECALAGQSLAGEQAALRSTRLVLLLAGGLILVAGVGVGWRITSAAIKPIEDISAAAARIANGDLSGRVLTADHDSELGRLGTVLNDTFARLEAAFARQQQFTADAAHELRTPLAVLIAETQTALSRDRAPADYRKTIEVSLDAAQQMRRLTETLLTLARLDSSEQALARGEVDLATVASGVIARLNDEARAHSLRLHTILSPAPAWTMRERMEQVVTNLVVNAINYTKPGGEVRVSTATDGSYAVLIVDDTGAGISRAHQAHVFERFYRVDQSRRRSEGHAGLGLAICDAIVRGEGGTIALESVEGEGSRFIVRIPRRDPGSVRDGFREWRSP